ncbi:MAG: DUF4279 domain-containing protein [Dethiobacter sp.]|jgi:hypothetical protein|nr:DUF4279 domain-containing protein [Dethiobacter sp.]MBS3902246.1 DUF4279 domain-containing protein [Dethiobacter sp.]MBS3989209.1 DUF4279 domain-containing protein [Dethiobacter sp.]
MSDEYFVSTKVWLIIKGEELDFNEISNKLGVSPLIIRRKGELLNNEFGHSEYDLWLYQISDNSNSPLSEQLISLNQIFLSKEKYFKELGDKYKLVVRCSYHSDLAQGELTISPEIFKIFYTCNISLEISFLSWGKVLDDEG